MHHSSLYFAISSVIVLYYPVLNGSLVIKKHYIFIAMHKSFHGKSEIGT